MITGAAGGLGGAFARDCAARGYHLYLTDLNPAGEKLATALAETNGVEVRFRVCDLTNPQARQDFIDLLRADGVRFWGLINVAGTEYQGAFLRKSRQQILTILRLNIESALDMTHGLLGLRDPVQRFRIINVSSLGAFYPMPYKATYSSTKRFLLNFSLALGEEIREFGTVTALCPAGLPTKPDQIKRIQAQGWWGKITTMDPGVVAHHTMDAALTGKKVYIPGFTNRLLQRLSAWIPVNIIVRLIGKRWSEAG
jgi:short-subunit dehydrogenase